MDKIGPRMLTVLHTFGPACLTFSVICRVLGGYPWHTEGVSVFFSPPVFSNDSQDYEDHLKNKITELLLKPVNSIFPLTLCHITPKPVTVILPVYLFYEIQSSLSKTTFNLPREPKHLNTKLSSCLSSNSF